MTFGHGTASRDELLDVLRGAGVEAVVDVRRFPGSRRHPHVARDELARWLPEAGLAYRWEPRLGGRRSRPKEGEGPANETGEPANPDPWWRVAAFAAYAAHTRTDEFRAATAELLEGVARQRTTVLCSESLWWRCHRRLVADVAVLLHGVPVHHLGHDGGLTEHVPAAGARVAADGVRYDRVEDVDRSGAPG
nr:DUF488 domain-containing protein [Cellulomonas sp. APG4]